MAILPCNFMVLLLPKVLLNQVLKFKEMVLAEPGIAPHGEGGGFLCMTGLCTSTPISKMSILLRSS